MDWWSAVDFRGRLAELKWLRHARVGVVLLGDVGVGKTALAAEYLRSVEPGAVVQEMRGVYGPSEIVQTLAPRLQMASEVPFEVRTESSKVLADHGSTWEAALRALRPIVEACPVTLFLDGFEENLRLEGSQWVVTDETLAAFLTGWIALDGRQRLIITSRYPFRLPDGAEERCDTRTLQGLALEDARGLLPTLDPGEQERAWRLLDGNPHCLLYLDGLLRTRERPFAALAERLTSPAQAAPLLLAELLDTVGDVARDLLLGLSVFRKPVDDRAAWDLQSGYQRASANDLPLPDGLEEALVRLEGLGLVRSAGTERKWLVPSSTRAVLTEPQLSPTPSLSRAHLAAARYWERSADRMIGNDIARQPCLVESLHHWWAVRDGGSTSDLLDQAVRPLLAWGAVDRAAALVKTYLSDFPEGSHLWMQGCLWTGVVHRRREEWQLADQWLHRAVGTEPPRGLHAVLVQSRALVELGWVSCELGDLALAENCAFAAADTANREGVGRLVADSWLLMGMVLGLAGDAAKSAQAVDNAFGIMRQTMRATDGDFQFQVGRVAELLRDLERARNTYEEAAALYAAEGNTRSAASARLKAARLALRRQDFDGAGALLNEASGGFAQVGDLRGLAQTLEELAVLGEDAGHDPEEVQSQYQRALRYFQDAGDQPGTARVTARLTALATRLDDRPEE